MEDVTVITAASTSSSSLSTSSPAFPLSSEHGYLLLLRLVDDVFAHIQSSNTLLDQHLAQLHALFGSTLEKAVGITDVEGVTKVKADVSGRFLFQVQGSEVRPYTCSLHRCSCPAYANSVLIKPDSIYCKHQLASRLCFAMGKMRERVVTDAEFNRMVSEEQYRTTHEPTSSTMPQTAGQLWSSSASGRR